MDNNIQSKRPHSIVMEEKKLIMITGVADVDSFNEETVSAILDSGEITIRGTNLHISKLSVETGELTIDGNIISLEYSDTIPSGGFLKKLFR